LLRTHLLSLAHLFDSGELADSASIEDMSTRNPLSSSGAAEDDDDDQEKGLSVRDRDGETQQKLLPLSLEDDSHQVSSPSKSSDKRVPRFLSFLGKKAQPVALPQSEPEIPLSPSARVPTASPLHNVPSNQPLPKETLSSGRDLSIPKPSLSPSMASPSKPPLAIAIADAKPAMLEGIACFLCRLTPTQVGSRRRIKAGLAQRSSWGTAGTEGERSSLSFA
jgi:hypothetical protein